MKFELTKEQEEKFNNWREEKRKTIKPAAIGGAFTFCFTPTGIGPIIEVQCVDGSKLDLTGDL